jgi:hypothetical protein
MVGFNRHDRRKGFSRPHCSFVNSVLQGVVEFKRLTHGGIMKARDIFLV